MTKELLKILRLKTVKGVSMPEVMIGLGMMGISGAFLAKLSRDADQKNLGMRARVEEREYIALVKSRLGDSAICSRNFSNQNLTRNGISQIVDENGVTLFSSASFGSGQGIIGESQAIQVSSWSTSPFPAGSSNPTAVNLNFHFQRVKEVDLMTSYTRSIKLFAKVNGSTIGECYGVRENVETNIKRLACNGGSSYDEATDTCTKNDFAIQSCPSGQFLTGVDNNGNFQCDSNVALLDTTGTTNCSNGQIMMGFDSNGNVVCQNLQYGHFAPFFPGRTVAGTDLYLRETSSAFHLTGLAAPTPTPIIIPTSTPVPFSPPPIVGPPGPTPTPYTPTCSWGISKHDVRSCTCCAGGTQQSYSSWVVKRTERCGGVPTGNVTYGNRVGGTNPSSSKTGCNSGVPACPCTPM